MYDTCSSIHRCIAYCMDCLFVTSCITSSAQSTLIQPYQSSISGASFLTGIISSLPMKDVCRYEYSNQTNITQNVIKIFLVNEFIAYINKSSPLLKLSPSSTIKSNSNILLVNAFNIILHVLSLLQARQ